MLKIPLFCHLVLDIIKLISDSISLLSCCGIFFVFAWRLLFYQMIIAELFPEKVNITVFVFESTIPVTLSLLAPCKDSTTITSLYCLVTRSNVSDVVLIVPNTIAALYLCKSILIDFPYISFLFTLLFYSSFTIAFFMFS